MGILYAVFIKPVELFIGFVFELLVGTGIGFGSALMLLSIVVTAATGPLYYLAERWKRQEEIVQRKMARDLASIKAHYTGQKRFYLTRNAHRLHGYSPLSPLRTSLGLLIQIPFFFGPYLYLTRFADYSGASFIVLRDLGRPDGLLWGANLLPFLMTAINVGASLLYTKKRTANDTFQLLALAGLFLVVLYDSPSALLLYWTMNNILAIPKNAILARLLPAAPPAPEDDGTATESLPRAALRYLRRADPAIPAFVAVFLLLGLQTYWELSYDRSFKYLLLLTALAGSALTVLYAVRRFRGRLPRSRATVVALVVEWLLFAFAAYLFLFARRQNAYISNTSVKLLAALLQDAVIFTAACALLPLRAAPLSAAASPTGPAAAGADPVQARRAPLAAAKRPVGLFGLSFSFLVAYLFLLSPVLMYFSSPKDIGMGIGELILRNGTPAILLAAIGIALYRCFPPRAQALALIAAFAAIIVVLAYNYLLPGDYGTLDELHLDKDYLLDSPRIGAFLLDIVIASLAILAAEAILRLQRTTVFAGFGVLAVAFSVQIAAAAAKTDWTHTSLDRTEESADLPPEYAEVHRFSTTGPNVVVVIADMCNGNYVGRLLDRFPGYREKLEGFVWYPNTLAISSTTVTSIPSILSGFAYAPEAMNAMGGTGKAKYAASVRDLCDTMLGRDLAPSLVDLSYFDLQGLSAQYEGAVRTTSGEKYVGAWKRRTGYRAVTDAGSGKNRLLVMVTLFQSAPTLLKAAVYDDGSWLIFRKSYQIRKMARDQVRTYAYLDLLPTLSTADAGPGTFKLIHTQFTHEPFGITAGGTIIENEFPDPASGTKSFVDGRGAFNNAKKMIDFIVAWADWMKEAGVWDNTYLVVVSDHGNNAMDGDITLPAGLSNPVNDWEVSRARALLLLKRPKATGPLREDERFMSNADAAAIVRRAAGAAAEDPSVGPAPSERSLTYSRYYGKWNDFMTSDRITLSTYEVADDLRASDNWSKR